MFRNYLKIAFRNLKRGIGFSAINIIGLALGMTVSFLILLYVRHELTYDRFHPRFSDTYRINLKLDLEGRRLEVPSVPSPMGPALVARFPEVEKAARFNGGGSRIISYQDKLFEESRFFHADSGLFDLFKVETLRGDPSTMLEAPFSLVLTEEMAAKYFGDEDPIGKVVTVNRSHQYAVTGVVKAQPSNSHLQYNFLGSLSSLQKLRNDYDNWMGFNYLTYVRLAAGTSPDGLAESFLGVIDENMPDQIRALKIQMQLILMPLARIHLYSHTEHEMGTSGNLAYIRIFTLIAFFILAIACINFMNLSTARSAHRAREVAMRKVLGAGRGKLARQFLGESLLLSLLSLLVAVGLILLLLPLFNRMIAQSLAFRPLSDWPVTLGFLGITVLVGLAAGSYPALFLSSFLPVEALHSRSKAGKGHRFFRNGLVSLQYIISISLIFCTLVIHGQLRHVRNHPLGFEKDRLVSIRLRGDVRKQAAAFKTEVSHITGVESCSLCSVLPSLGNSETYFSFEGIPDGGRQVLPFIEADEDYLRTLGLTLTSGRNFSREFSTDEKAVILNETLARRLEWGDPIGRTINMLDADDEGNFFEVPYRVIGMVRDFHFESLHEKIRGHLIKWTGETNRLAVKLRPQDLAGTLARIEWVWKGMDSSYPFEFTFLDERLDRLYRTEERLGRIFIAFTMIAIFVACLGLFGLAAFSAEQRIKEIGIRRVLGASVPGVVVLLSREFTKWVLLANLAAWPIAFYAMNRWLQDFAYRIHPGPAMFLLSGGLAFLIALITISFRTLRAASASPVRSLRYE
jgi:putative ABC transport system permease protein